MSKSNFVYNFWVVGTDGVRYWYTQTDSLEALEPRIKEFKQKTPPDTYRTLQTTIAFREHANVDIKKEWPV